jgi:hypothetical protein
MVMKHSIAPFRRTAGTMATIAASRRRDGREVADDNGFEAVVLFSMLGLMLFLPMVSIIDSEAIRYAMLYAG